MNFKPTIKRAALPFLVLGAGGVGLTLRVLLYTLGTDSRGLLPRYHALHVLALLLTLLVTAGLAWAVRPLGGSNRYRKNVPASTPAAFADFCSAGWLLTAAFALLERAEGKLDLALAGLAFLSVASLLVTGWCRLKGTRPFFGFHGILCVFLVLNLVCQYRNWSGNPQLPDYIFHIFACIFLTLTAYYRTAFDLGMGKRRIFLFCSLMAVYLCFLSLTGAGDGRFYFAGGVWAFGNLCPLDPPPRHHLTETIRIPTIPERP